ncbi:MAG: hypothetical protein J1F40_06980 [Prevotellaceae bacterium]|nr:hypothetical protein [Prevotellaceae bacterium]
MKRLLIKNFGPVGEASLTLGKVNVIIGKQSSGKSCVLKTACYCSWVEKRIELAQSVEEFSEEDAFIVDMARYYDMAGYVHSDTYIEYETSHLMFCYDNASKTFEMKWKSGHWNYKRPKISYVPADRNMVAALPTWKSLELDGNMLEFMSDWDKARKFMKKEENFLNLGMSYIYDSRTNTDSIKLGMNDKTLMLKESSSGIQSLLPMYVHIDYLSTGQYKDTNTNTKISYAQREEYKSLRDTIYHNQYEKKRPKEDSSVIMAMEDGGYYRFADKKDGLRFRRTYRNYVMTHHSEIFLEEPEDNLFPPTQCQFVDWLLAAAKKHKDMLFIATHSPYILNQLIKNDPKGLTVFFTHVADDETRRCSVRQLSEEEVGEFYGNGVDMFFNFEQYL